ncbi:MAG: universal stress protein [Thermoproteota archaeon]|nr:universal stress protein [Thermoproteota archaeon]
MFSKILVPVDGSDISYRALDTALFLSERLGSKITAIHVMEQVPTVYIQSQKLLDELLEAHKNESQKILDKCSSIATQKGIVINTTLFEGNPASTILEFSQREKYEVIIIGSRGMGHFKELVLGSVSSKILHHSLCPVLLIR